MRVAFALRIIFGICIGLSSTSSGTTADSITKYYDVKLYAPKPPPGSTYVRIMNAGSRQAKFTIGDSKPFELGPIGQLRESYISTYRLDEGGKNLAIGVDGHPSIPLAIPPDSYLTIIYRPDTFGTLKTIVDDPGDDTSLLAQLRIYNLVKGCEASLALPSGRMVFTNVQTDRSEARFVNPIAATLVPKCSNTTGPMVRLPRLRAHDHFSFVIFGKRSRPQAIGALDGTETNNQ